MSRDAVRVRPVGSRLGSLGTGNLVVALLAAAAAASLLGLDLSWRDLVPDAGGLELAGRFFSRAWRPALAFEGAYSTGAAGVVWQAARGAVTTVAVAAAAVSLAVAGGLALGFLGAGSLAGGRAWRAVNVATRLVTNLLRSIHELVWAVLLLAALGRHELTAVVAIALPYAGVLGKIYAEMLDEAPRDAGDALGLAGAAAWQRFLAGQLPRALPDMLAYTFYRFECALRSSAVLGFFGFPTLGYYLAASFENLHYGEVWTYLYAMFVLVLAVDWWSGRLRRELLA